MAKAKYIEVKETLKELQILKRNQPVHLKPRIQMLILMKRSKEPLTKEAMAMSLCISNQTSQTWRGTYEKSGMAGLLTFKRTKGKAPLLNEQAHKAIEKKLSSSTEAFTSFTELQQWVSDNYLPGIKYTTINEYVKRKFGAKLKVARKSHINKDEAAVAVFKNATR